MTSPIDRLTAEQDMSDCTHEVIQTWGDGTTAVMWACAAEDCSLRFYPACRECVDVGHRNIVHEARAPLDRIALATAIRDGFTHLDRPLDDGFEVYASAQEIADEIIAQLAAKEPRP